MGEDPFAWCSRTTFVERLGLDQQGTAVVTYADERQDERPVAGPVTVRIGNRTRCRPLLPTASLRLEVAPESPGRRGRFRPFRSRSRLPRRFDTVAVAQQARCGVVARDQAGGHRQGDPRRPRARATTLRPTSSGPASPGCGPEIANLDTRLSTDIAGMRTELARLETRLIATVVVAALRFLG